MKRLQQIFLLPVVVFIGLAFFASVNEAKLGESRNNNRIIERHDKRALKQNLLGQCQGDCDVDEHCKGRLICFHRQGSEPVPGCKGGEKDFSSSDYCVDPKFIVSDDKKKLPHLKWLGKDPRDEEFPLQECEGDCDKDSDCAAGLICLQRRTKNSGSVPGCTGRDDGLTDYCVKSSLITSYEIPLPPPPRSPRSPTFPPEEKASTSTSVNQFDSIQDFALKLYWEPHYMWQEENFDDDGAWNVRMGNVIMGIKPLYTPVNEQLANGTTSSS
eukprot:CAMPEP_0201205640 /NCGR_PEP_ID=MMETSP0851-20130426/171277_1 /ASSEMBLY_ACC=CAM_ASM_000631 /TAXON_ID=183588 /ORGANISM="Pseudo-nitzschia fraudulenta, Strain WWA7" /LENGTH=270 /DNA_ID=CAMNT_0047493905 /DNA_START=94 /DNA_END=907 /DNA_ORIENTATION=+